MTAEYATFEILWSNIDQRFTLIIEHDDAPPQTLIFDDSERLLTALEHRMEEILT